MKNLILICGDEEYLKEKKKNELLNALNAEGSMNFNVFSGDNIDLPEIRRLSDTVPFCEKYRKILIKDSGFFKDRKNIQAIASENAGDEFGKDIQAEVQTGAFTGDGTAGFENDTAGNSEVYPDTEAASCGRSLNDTVNTYDPASVFSGIPASTVILFEEKNVQPSSPMYKLLKKEGEIYRFDRIENKKGRDRKAGEAQIKDWALGIFKKSGRNIDTAALNCLIQLVGYDMENLAGEAEKLICFMLDRPKNIKIGISDINAICSKTLSDRVFAMIDSKMKGKTGEAVQMLEELFALKVPPMKTLYLLMRQYNQALSVRECMDMRMSDAQIMAKTELKDWQLRRIKEQITGISADSLKNALENCADMEYKVKKGNIGDRLALEILIL